MKLKIVFIFAFVNYSCFSTNDSVYPIKTNDKLAFKLDGEIWRPRDKNYILYGLPVNTAIVDFPLNRNWGYIGGGNYINSPSEYFSINFRTNRNEVQLNNKYFIKDTTLNVLKNVTFSKGSDVYSAIDGFFKLKDTLNRGFKGDFEFVLKSKSNKEIRITEGVFNF